ncbi:hypothetical protein B0T24DRAFT_671777 [Lasiosphaeria ovina]|uniref:Secreted protein n=1 Tax=Lasiosphaeria ovina TaxID=92902 RepID=A0AAE0JST8_9PEZI|nr:hypothetical protein B0T24DRAFT_671777 [Lasiosphaeria ovina]
MAHALMAHSVVWCLLPLARLAAAGGLFPNLLRFGDLRYLWPQLIAPSLTWKRSHRTIERLLRRYSDHLCKLVLNETDELITEADRALRIQALGLCADRVSTLHGGSVRPTTTPPSRRPIMDSDHEGLERKDGGRPFHNRDSGSDGNDDSLFVFEFAHTFLFRTDPILLLQANVKAFARFRATDTTSPWDRDRIWNRAKLTFENTRAFLTGKHRPSQLANSTRLHWTCNSPEQLRTAEGLEKHHRKSYYLGLRGTIRFHKSARQSVSLPRHRQDEKQVITTTGACTSAGVGAAVTHDFLLPSCAMARSCTSLRFVG